jgi:hypothetical protein
MRRRHARAADLASRRVDPLGRDLRPVLIEPHHDRPRTLHARALEHRARRPRGIDVQPDALRTVGHGRYLLFELGRPRGRNPRAP